MNARSAGSASHADAVDADMTDATRDEKRDRGRSRRRRAPARVRGRVCARGSGATGVSGSQKKRFLQHVL
jgi:hypothetical protein